MDTGSSDRRTSNKHMRCSAEIRPKAGAMPLLAAALCCLTPLCVAQSDPQLPGTSNSSQSSAASGGGTQPIVVAEAPQAVGSKPGKRQVRQAEAAYVSGAKKLDADDLDGAERDFVRALGLDPSNRNYAIAISVARQHRVTQLVQQSTKARLAGDTQKAQTLLAQAREMDPQNPIVLEHSQVDSVPAGAQTTGPAAASVGPDAAAQPWRIATANIAGPIVLQPSTEIKSFDSPGQSADLLRDVPGQFGIRAVIDPSVQSKNIHFALANVSYERAMYALMMMTDSFAVPVDERTILIARDDPTHRADLDRQLQETIDVPGATAQKLQEIANVIRNVFNVKDAVVDPSAGRIIVRGPASVFEPLNRTLEPLMADPGEVTLEIRMYEINSNRTVKAGVKLPTQFTAFNVDQAANQIVNDNQAIVQQAIAQGLISSTASNLQIALALIGSGLVQSDIAKNLLGVFGGGTLMTGISSPDLSMTINLGRTTSDTRTLDDVQLRVRDQQEATFRAGTRYPITTSTYVTGLSTAASAVGNATINGVNVSNLLNRFAGGTSATIPQVTYEDLGLTLKAKPTFRTGGHISMQLDLTIQAISGSGINNIPVLLNRHFTTSLTVADGESAMLVSDVSKTETAAMVGIPGLSELPGLHLPTERDTVNDSGQLVVLVTPHVVRNRADNVAGPRMALHLPSTQ
jgi:general secretion pathway protein D